MVILSIPVNIRVVILAIQKRSWCCKKAFFLGVL